MSDTAETSSCTESGSARLASSAALASTAGAAETSGAAAETDAAEEDAEEVPPPQAVSVQSIQRLKVRAASLFFISFIPFLGYYLIFYGIPV
ncbi:MAG: hypothetical protein EGQ01_00090 [Ruminococcaceae bacterium]|nr:hypothetical protein [Oscillospiraceae bacterium]